MEIDNDNDDVKTAKKPKVYEMKDFRVKYAEKDKDWREGLGEEVEQWLLSHWPYDKIEIIRILRRAKRKPTIEEKRTGVFNVNISTPLIQTLCFLEDPEKGCKNKYFKQIAFIHCGRDHSGDTDDENEDENGNENKKNVGSCERSN